MTFYTNMTRINLVNHLETFRPSLLAMARTRLFELKNNIERVAKWFATPESNMGLRNMELFAKQATIGL